MTRWVLMAGLLVLGGSLVQAQEFGDLSGRATGSKGQSYVTYVPEPLVIQAGRRTEVPLRLQVLAGFHVNSHTPKSDLLIPTVLVLGAAEDRELTVGPVQYPAGVSYRFAADPSEVLDVYEGTVVVRVPVTATKGEHVLRGTLRYQACDARSCFPPKTVAVDVPFTAR